MMMHYKSFLFFLVIVFFAYGCKEEHKEKPPMPVAPETTVTEVVVPEPGCANCHTDIVMDQYHAFDCTECHQGDNQTAEKQTAHSGLVSEPASPDNMSASCGRCHPEQIERCRKSLHFTLTNEVNLTRKHFGAKTELQSLTEIPTQDDKSGLSLVDDMLRRRCLRCHVYSSGDDYPYTTRGKGCAACHLQFIDGKLQRHTFFKTPGDWQCVSCHYANHVGADYYGQYEHDFNWEYRTPYTTTEPFVRPYGVELHDLVPDIHQQKGLVCTDCHDENSLKSPSDTGMPRCSTCHLWKPGDPKPPADNIRIVDNALVLTDKSGEEHLISAMRDPAHARYGKEVACQVCHAQWAFNDGGTYLLRSESDDFDPMERLIVQSSSWVEYLLDRNLNSAEDEIDPVMADGITGQVRPGVWYMGYTQRRWSDILIRRDTDGIIKVFRPILDLHLSAVDADEDVLFDNLEGRGSGLLPYTPHTTGPAGLFYLQRFSSLLDGNPAKADNP